MTTINQRIPTLVVKGFDELFYKVVNSVEWRKIQDDFNKSSKILIVGNGGNLAVADHAAIDIGRLTNKSTAAPGSGILASSLINDLSHDDWIMKWVEITLRGLSKESIQNIMIIGISSSGLSKNICNGLEYGETRGIKTALISASTPKIPGNYNTAVIGTNEYHTGEVMTLLLFYQLIHGAGFECPCIDKASMQDAKRIDYSC